MSIAHSRKQVAAPPLTVASVPSGHVYVRHLAPIDGRGAVRLPDPDPNRPDRPAGATWWPPVMLDPEWARTADFDVFHLHFGFDAVRPEELDRLARVLRGRGKPFVFTVHDLRNPHHDDRRLHDEQLDVLVRAADAVVTLTPGAAREIEVRWGRTATVVPHPHVVDLPTIARALEVRPRRRHRPFRVGLHLKSLRANMDPMRILPTLVDTVADLDDAVLQVNCHRDILDADGARRDEELSTWLRDEAAFGRLELEVHDYFSDDDLWSLPRVARPVGPALHLRHPLGMARGVPRPPDDGPGPDAAATTPTRARSSATPTTATSSTPVRCGTLSSARTAIDRSWARRSTSAPSSDARSPRPTRTCTAR